MDEIGVCIVDLQATQARLERGLHAFRPMVVIPQLGRDEKIFATNDTVIDRLLDDIADDIFVAISLGGIQVEEPDLERRLYRGATFFTVGST